MSRRDRPGFGRLSIAVICLLGAGPALGQNPNADVLRAYVDVWNTGEVERLDDLLTEDFRRHGAYGPAESRAQMRGVIENSRKFYRGLHMELHQAVANPEKGAMRWRVSGSWGTTRFELDGTNFSMVHFEDGKISEEWVMGNYMDLFRTFGYRLTPPQDRIVPPEIEQPPGPALAERMRPRTEELDAYARATLGRELEQPGAVEITSEVACRLALDGRSIGWLAPGGSVSLRLERGKHRLAASSLGGSAFFEESFTVRAGKTAAIGVKAPGKVIRHPRHRTAEDLTTGLMWQSADNGEDATKAAAEAHCHNLDQGGHDDWRLPTIHELQGLHSPTSKRRYRTIDGVRLSDCCPWSSTPHGDFFWTYAFAMDMRYLQHESLGYHMRVLCVRDAAAASTPSS